MNTITTIRSFITYEAVCARAHMVYSACDFESDRNKSNGFHKQLL